jgi:hypothetical protein
MLLENVTALRVTALVMLSERLPLKAITFLMNPER